jgi:hypothetical protein
LKTILAGAAALLLAACSTVPLQENVRYVPERRVQLECTMLAHRMNGAWIVGEVACSRVVDETCYIILADNLPACALDHERRHCREGEFHGVTPRSCTDKDGEIPAAEGTPVNHDFSMLDNFGRAPK